MNGHRIAVEFEQPAAVLYKEAPPVPQQRGVSRVERVNCAALAAILLVLVLLLGSYIQPATSATPTPEPAVSAATESDQEPSGVRGLTIAELHKDAALTLASIPQSPPSGQFTSIPEYAASYDGTPPTFPATYLTVESSNLPGIFHVFSMVAAQRA